MDAHYDRTRLAEALREVGLGPGDVVFSHGNVGFFGMPDGGAKPDNVFQTVYGAFMDVIGEGGTLVVPTFTFSFFKRETFDHANTPSACGMFTEVVRLLPDAIRSHDPIYSVAAVGPLAGHLTADAPIESFGEGSFWEKFLAAGGIICNLNFDAGSTFLHYVERELNVPYRYDKLFTGRVRLDGVEKKSAAIFFCQDMSNPDTVAAFEPFDTLARERGVARSAPVGRGAVVGIRAKDAFDLVRSELPGNPWLLTEAAKTGRTPVLLRPFDTARFGVDITPDATMREMAEAVWALPRDIISDGYDAALYAFAGICPMTVHEYQTGSSCWSWLVPERWECREAYLETRDGGRLFSYADDPLHVVSYSLPFRGEVTREELFAHLHTHPMLPDATPLVCQYYERDWGLCCGQGLKDSLTDDKYRVVIDTAYSFGTLKVGEVVVPGETEDCFVLCAHLCHPATVNDGLSGVVVGLDVMRELMKRSGLRYTYRLLILPETIGSVAYLSHNESLIPKMKGGLFLEMLGLENPHGLQLSFTGDTGADECLTLALKAHDPEGWTGPFRSIIQNDEKQFNAPGVRVPMLSLSRVLRPDDKQWPYPEYHSSRDTMELCSEARLIESRDLVLAMIDTFEADVMPVPTYRGEVFCSRYGFHIDFTEDPEGNTFLFDIIHMVDGSRTVAEIAKACGAPFSAVSRVVAEMKAKGLVRY